MAHLKDALGPQSVGVPEYDVSSFYCAYTMSSSQPASHNTSGIRTNDPAFWRKAVLVL